MRRDVFQAFADPTLRAILRLVAFQAMTPNALAENSHCSLQAESKHLRVLVECQLIGQEQAGREIYFHLNAKILREVDKWQEPLRRLWKERFNQLDTVLKNLKNNKS